MIKFKYIFLSLISFFFLTLNSYAISINDLYKPILNSDPNTGSYFIVNCHPTTWTCDSYSFFNATSSFSLQEGGSSDIHYFTAYKNTSTNATYNLTNDYFNIINLPIYNTKLNYRYKVDIYFHSTQSLNNISLFSHNRTALQDTATTLVDTVPSVGSFSSGIVSSNNIGGFTTWKYSIEFDNVLDRKYAAFYFDNNFNFSSFDFYLLGYEIIEVGPITSLNDINSTIGSDTIDNSDLSDKMDGFLDLLPSNGVITNLVTLPISLYTKVLNGVNGACSTFNFGSLWGSDLSFPCINLSTYLGATLWTSIDVLISGFFIFNIAKKMIKSFNQFTSFKDGDVISD